MPRLSVILLLLVVGVLLPVGCGSSGSTPSCVAGTVSCGQSCSITATDKNNCGACGTVCPTGESCIAGACSGTTCNGGTTSCSGSCVDTKSDPANCGQCAHACGAGGVCSTGTCATTCPGNATACSGSCVDTSSDPANCGQCGHSCPGGVCASGACATSCGSLTMCGPACVDTSSDPANCGQCGQACSAPDLCSGGKCVVSNIKHVVIIVEENHTFDSYFGNYCTAAAGSNPSCTGGPSCCEGAPATDPSGAFPLTLDDTENEGKDRDHDQVCEVQQIDNGAMDHYVTGSGITIPIEDELEEYECSDPNTWVTADASSLGTYWGYADSGALADRYFQPMIGSTSGNDMYLAVARWQFSDDTLRPNTIGTGCVGIGGTAIEWSGVTTVADLLINNGFSFVMYADGYDQAVSASPYCATTELIYPPDCETAEKTPFYSPCNYDPSDLPFEYYQQFADNPKNLVDAFQFTQDVSSGNLPTVAYVKPRTYTNEHPKWSTISRGVSYVSNVINAIQASAYASDTLILLTWDEGGGFFDHVSPPPAVDTKYDSDISGAAVPYGTRVPFLVIGPFARAGEVSHVQMEHSSVVRFLEYNFLGQKFAGALGNRDAAVNDIGSLLDPSTTGVVIPEGP